jgi:hypothetical protein
VVFYLQGTYSTTSGNPSISAQTNGRIGVNVVNQTANLYCRFNNIIGSYETWCWCSTNNTNDGDVWLESNTNTGLKIRISGVNNYIKLKKIN